MTADAAVGNRRADPWIALASATLVIFGALGLARFGYSVVLPAMQESLGLDNTQAGLLATAHLAGYLVASVLGGALATRIGPRPVAVAGAAVTGVAMLLTAIADGFISVTLWRTIAGLGSGAAVVPAYAVVSEQFSRSRRGLAMGISSSGSSVALIVSGPVAAVALGARGIDGWRWCWAVFGGVTVVIAAAVGVALGAKTRRDRPARPRSGGRGGWGDLAASAEVRRFSAVYAAFGFSYIIYMIFFVKRLVGELGWTQVEAGELFLLLGWFSLFCGVIWGHVSDRIGRHRALALIFLAHAASYALFALRPTPVWLTISATLFGLCAWSIPAVMAAACADVIGPARSPAVFGVVTLFMGLGQAAGPAVGGWIADRTGSFVGAFVLAAVVALIGAVIAVFPRPASPPGPAASGSGRESLS